MTIDTEEEWDWSAGWPVRNLSVTNIRQLPRFQSLCTRYGVATTYFANQAVFDNDEARDILLGIARKDRVEIGMHIHPWNTAPFDDIKPLTPRLTFVHNLPPDVVAAKLGTVYQSFLRNGITPTSFRGGRYSTGEAIQTFLRDHQFLADASVLPFSTWEDEGAPDYRQRGLYPVRLPPRRENEAPLWEIPLTLGFTRRPFAFWAKCYDLCRNRWLRKLRLIGISERLGLVRKIWLNFEDPLGERMLPFLHELRRLDLPYICFTVHSSSLAAGVGPYTRTRADEDRIFEQMEKVFATLSQWANFRSATISEIARNLEQQYHAYSRN